MEGASVGDARKIEFTRERERERERWTWMLVLGFLGLPRRIDTNFRCSCLLQTRVSLLPFSFVFARERICVSIVYTSTRRKSICIDVSNVRRLLLLCIRIIRKYTISNLHIVILCHYVVAFNLNILAFAFYKCIYIKTRIRKKSV